MDFRPNRCPKSGRIAIRSSLDALSTAAPSLATLSLGLAAGIWLASPAAHVVGQQIQIQQIPNQQIQIQVGGVTAPTDADDPYGVYLPTDRTLSRGIAQARERLDDREYNEALAFLQQILDRDEDAFLNATNDAESNRGLKAAARSLIANLPADGRQMYELLHTAAARRELDAALNSGNRDDLAKLVRRYFLTPPGYEAALVLAQMEFDRGHPLSAASLYEQLRANGAAAKQFEPQLSLLTAVSWIAAGDPQQAAAAIRSLTDNYAQADVELVGRKLRLPAVGASDAELLAWLDESVGQSQPTEARNADWLTERGDPSRNRDHRGGAPHLSARWQSRVVNDPRFESFLTSRRQQAEQQGFVAISAARPIAAGNVVVMRTPQNVVAVDFQTGKRIWETREEEAGARDQFLADFNSASRGDDLPPMTSPVEQRVWDDTLGMSLSSDGERVFALGGMPLVERERSQGWGIGPAFGGTFDFAAPTNRLTAYELATEGKLAWEIDGESAGGDLAGAFFLGPPLTVDGTLYVLAEIRSAVYLLALEPATGALHWRQQLVGLEQGITLDPRRRLNGASPSYAAGILVCPTTAGMVVATDAIRREFAWVYQYPRQVDGLINVRQGWQGRRSGPFVRGNNHWLDGSVVIADGKVLVTPPDSAEIHCLDLATGKLAWKEPREKSLFVGCVDRGKVLLVGSDAVTAVRLADKSPAWTEPRIELPEGTMPSGLGYLSAGHYYLPLTSGQVIAVDTQDGTVTGATDTHGDAPIGNLICHRGAILSQSTLLLEKFEQIDVLRERAQTALAANPRDAAAIRDLAEMKRLEGALPEAVRMLKQAYEIDPADPQTRDMLADALLEALASDYALHRADLPLVRKIAYRPQQQIELLRIDAAGLDAEGEPMEAFDAYLRLADATAADPALLSIGPEWSVRSDRWIRTQINEIWAGASGGQRETISEQLRERQRDWATPPTAGQLQTYLAHFGGLPGTDENRLRLIHELLDRGEVLDTEIELLRLEESPSTDSQAAAAILLTDLLVSQGRLEVANKLAETILARWTDSPAVDGKSPQQWCESWRPELAAAARQAAWPRGRVEVDQLPAVANNRRNKTRRAQTEYQLALRKVNLEQTPGTQLGPSQWFVAQDNSRLIGRNGEGKDIYRFSAARSSAMRQFTGNSDMVQAGQVGDLLYIAFGGQMLALDTRETGDNGSSDVVWQASPAGRFAVAPQRTRRRAGQPIYHASSQRKRIPASAGILLAGLGPVTADGVVFQDQQLRCVDPISGETLWSRTDIPQGCELFGDEQFVLAASTEQAALYVIRMSDGQLVNRRELPEPPWLLTAGRNVVQLRDTKTDGQAKKTLRMIDAVSGERLFEADLDPAACTTTLEPEIVAVVEPSGKFQLLNVRSGSKIIEEKLPLAVPPKSLTALKSGDQLFLCVSGQSRPVLTRPIGPDYPVVAGQVFAFDLQDGRPLWPGPATIEQRGIALAQPTSIPVLVLVDRLVKRDAGGANSTLRLLCLDKQTGATVYRNDDLADTPGGQFHIRASHDDPASVTIEMSTKTIRLRFTDEPRPPEPPANESVEAPRKSLGRGLWGVGQRMGSVIQGVIRDPTGTNWPLPASSNADDDEDELQDELQDDD
jgi:outer membrane protein assembly factor BamB